MRQAAYNLVLFYICINLACGFIIETGLLPGSQIQPASSAEQMPFWSTASSLTTISSIAIPGIGGLIAVITGHLFFGAALLVLAALTYLFPIFQWLINGFPVFIAHLNVPTPIYAVLQVLIGFIVIVFIIEFMGGRQVS